MSPKSPVAHVSQVFRSVTDQLFKFGVSAWVIHGEKSVGAVVATVTTDARMGLADLETESFVTAVLALRDSNLMVNERCSFGANKTNPIPLLNASGVALRFSMAILLR